VEETSKLKRLVSLDRDEGSGPEREVWESCTKTRVGGRERIVKARFVLLKSCRMFKADNAERENGMGEAASVRRLLEESLREDTRGGVVPVAS